MTFRNVGVTIATFTLLALTAMAAAQDKPVSMVHTAKAATAYVLLPANKGSASAFCIDPAGYFVTNVHVVKDLLPGQKVSLVLNSGEDNESVIQAAAIQLDREDDLALLRAEGFKKLTALPLGDCASLSETDQVTAFGYPFGNMLALDKGGHPNISVNVARVSSLRRHEGKLQLIQLDSQLNPGNSGGPVIDASGKVVGVVSSGVLSAGINFAVPVDKLTAMLAKPQIVFDPPTIADSRRNDPVTLNIQTFTFANAAPQLNVEVILSTPDGTERTFPAHPTGPNMWIVSVVPLPPKPSASLYPAVITFADSSMHCTVDDVAFQLDGKPYKLSQISRLDTHDGSTTITLLDSSTVNGTKLTIPTLKGRIGGQSIPVDASHAISLVLERNNSDSPNVTYRIVAKSKGTVVAEATGSLLGGPAPGAVASNSGAGAGTTSVGPADYCTILFSSKLQDVLSLTEVQRNQCADMNARLDYMLERAVNLPTSRIASAGMMVARAKVALDREGQTVQGLITSTQDQKFRGMFVDGVLRPIQVRVLQSAPRLPHLIGVRSAGGVQIVYTDIGKQPEPGRTGILPPVASAPPDAPIPSSPPPASEPPRIDRPRATSGIRMERLRPDERSALATIHSSGDARRMVKDPDPARAVAGAYWLATAPVEEDQREDVLVSLKPHLNEFDSKHRLTFVMAFERWADVAHAADLAAVVDSPAEVEGLTSHPSCWAVAVAGLVRLSPHMAREAVDHRISNFFFRVETTKALRPIADSDDPAHALAVQIIENLRTYH